MGAGGGRFGAKPKPEMREKVVKREDLNKVLQNKL